MDTRHLILLMPFFLSLVPFLSHLLYVPFSHFPVEIFSAIYCICCFIFCHNVFIKVIAYIIQRKTPGKG